jgi:hypothetical protein
MNGLLKFIAKLFGGGRPSAPYASAPPSPRSIEAPELSALEPLAPGVSTPPPVAPNPPPPPPPPEPTVVLLELTEDEDVEEEPDDESDEPDPTLGRYEELRVPVLDAAEIDAQRAAAEAEGLARPHKVFPHDPAGPGSLAETLARLEARGRVTSRVCEDAEHGFYVMYEPTAGAADV